MANGDGLGRMEGLLKELGNPEKDLKIIHVAGTNGKGSTCVMIASILQEAGYSVGLYTSPHLETECERVQIWDKDGRRMIEQSVLDKLQEKVDEALESFDPEHKYGALRVFERYTAAAYMYYKDVKPDYVILECGMGGRHDSTNTIKDPLACVITQVGLDHTDELGKTIEEVAYNKAGIIKHAVPVISQSDIDSVKDVIKRVADENGSEFYDVNEYLNEYDYLKPAMQGDYQKKNAVTAALAVKAAGAEVTREILEKGIATAVLPGRFEILNENRAKASELNEPLFIVDGAHNPDAMRALVSEYSEFVKEQGIDNTIFVFGCMKDKNSAEMVDIITTGLDNCEFFAVSIEYGRAEEPEVLARMISESGRECRAFDSTAEAFESAMNSGADSVLAAGSIYLAGDMRTLYKIHEKQV